MTKNIFIITWLILICILPSAIHAEQSPNFILSWATDTYIPPFYAGKAMPTIDSFIKVTASPAFSSAIDINTLKFNWFLDGRLVGKSSGEGKSEYIFKASKSVNSVYEIKLRVLYSNSKLLSEKTIFIKIMKPEIIWQTADSPESIPSIINPDNKFYLTSKQNINFIAQPLFFNIQKLTDLNFFWQFDEQKFEDPNKTNQHIFNLATDQIGNIVEKVLKLAVINKAKPFEKNTAELNLVFSPFGE